jgi:dihydroorotase
MRNYIFICLFSLMHGQLLAQPYDWLIKGGTVIDPKNGIHKRLDIAVKDGIIVKVDRNIPVKQASRVIQARGLYVTPGLIDLHTHIFTGPEKNKFANGGNSLSPDEFSFRSGVTTMVDAGTSGAANFPRFKEQVIDASATRVLAFLNIAAEGLSGKPLQEDLSLMSVDSALARIRQFPEQIIGIKIGHYELPGLEAFQRAAEAAQRSGKPLLVECHLPQMSLEEQLSLMHPGDIITHTFEQVAERQPVVDEAGLLRSYVLSARDRGILFDLGHGGAGFWFSQAIPALKQGFTPFTFGTDLHRFSMNAGMKNLLNVLSKFMSLGMSLDDVLLRATWNPAKAIRREDLGHLSPGAVADIALLRMSKGTFGYVDAGGNKITGHRKLEAELTLRAGKVVWDLNGLTAKPYPASTR